MLPAMESEGDDIELRPLRRAEYHQLGELGCFEDERVELLEGVIAKMSPVGRKHRVLEELLVDFVVKSIPRHLIVRAQLPLAVSEISEPVPDLSIVDRQTFFENRPFDELDRAYLVVELAASSLKKDLGVKARLYASGGVRDYWVVDLEKLVITVHRDPNGPTFESVQQFDRYARVQSLLVPEVSVCLEDLVGD